jgi:ATP-dependent DNA ligase
MDSDNIDLKIAGFAEGEGKASGTLGKVELETTDGVYVGNSGSGFSDEERDEIWSNQDEWMGRCIEIEARGLGTQSKLRMPIFVRDRSDDGTADSWKRVQELMQDV